MCQSYNGVTVKRNLLVNYRVLDKQDKGAHWYRGNEGAHWYRGNEGAHWCRGNEGAHWYRGNEGAHWYRGMKARTGTVGHV